MVNFSDEADRLLIFVSGHVLVEFEHPTVVRPSMKLKGCRSTSTRRRRRRGGGGDEGE